MTAAPSGLQRFGGWAAIASGTIGMLAFAFLIAFLVKRLSGGSEGVCIPLIRAHDFGAMLQSALMIPAVLALSHMGAQRGRLRSTAAIAALAVAVLCLLLIFLKIVPDDLYMIPLGLVGVWLIAENRRQSGFFGRKLTRLGVVSGIGLLLVAVFPIGFTLFVDRSHLNGWTPFDYQPPPGTDVANAITHILLVIGTFMGAATYPVWTALAGSRLLRTHN